MNKSIVVGAVIIAIAVILASAIHIYFSPYWSCVRAKGSGSQAPEVSCAAITSRKG